MKLSRPPTQKQIAARLGISQALVSRALSGRGGDIGASRETVERICRIAAELNYQPSATALALLGAPTRTIGVIVKSFDDPYFGKLIGALQSLARDSKYSLLLTGPGPEDLTGLRRHRVDGVIIAGSDFLPEGLADFAREGMFIIQIGAGTVFPGAMQIRVDEESALRAMVDYLAGLGHREIGFVATEKHSNRRRAEILRQCIRAKGLPVRTKSFFFSPGTPAQAARSAAEALRGLGRLPGAIVAAEDSIAIALLRELHEAGLRVPRDLSIAGFDDITAAELSIPPLTTIRQPIPEMAAAAFHAITTSRGLKTKISLPGQLVIRQSCSTLNTNQP